MRTLWYSAIGISLSTVLLVTSPGLIGVLIARFLLGIITTIAFNTSFALGLEVSPSHLRVSFGILIGLPYAAMVLMMAAVAYWSRNWIEITLIASIPVFLQLLFANPLVHSESPRWLVSKGRLAEAEAVILRAARLNKTTANLPTDLTEVLRRVYIAQATTTSKQGQDTMKQRACSLLASGAMRRLTFISMTLWLVLASLYISVPLAANSVTNPFLYIAMLGLSETPAYSASAPITARFGRRRVVSVALAGTAVLEALIVGVQMMNIKADLILMVLAAVAYPLICAAWQVALMFSSELYPTTVRALGSSITLTTTNIGYNIPPLLQLFLPAGMQWMSTALYSGMAVVAAVLVLLLPETNGKPLLQTVDEYIQARKEETSGLGTSEACIDSKKISAKSGRYRTAAYEKRDKEEEANGNICRNDSELCYQSYKETNTGSINFGVINETADKRPENIFDIIVVTNPCKLDNHYEQDLQENYI